MSGLKAKAALASRSIYHCVYFLFFNVRTIYTYIIYENLNNQKELNACF